jgi:hypothetical protein
VGWKLYNAGLELYFARQFEKAARYFAGALERLPGDQLTQTFLARARLLAQEPPGPEWTGTTVITEK